MRLRRALALGSMAGLACLLSTSGAGAFRYLTCNGKPVRWSAPFGTVQNLCSIPSGSPQAKAYASALSQWRGVEGMQDMVFHFGTWPSDHCSINLNDGVNDVALVESSVIDGALGTTIVVRSCEKIEEVNVLVANLSAQSFENPDEAFAVGTCPYALSRTGQATMLHELGHAHGLAITSAGGPDNHPLNFTVMRPSPPVPLGGGGAAVIHDQPMPDDAAGGRFLYPSDKTERNLMASAQRFTTSGIRNTAPWKTIQRCRGETFSFRWTTANTGTVSLTSDQRFYLAPSPSAHGLTGITLATWFGATVDAQKEVHAAITVKIPCTTPPGLYWLYHEADAGHVIAEVSESDNVIHNPLTIQVGGCGCST